MRNMDYEKQIGERNVLMEREIVTKRSDKCPTNGGEGGRTPASNDGRAVVPNERAAAEAAEILRNFASDYERMTKPAD